MTVKGIRDTMQRWLDIPERQKWQFEDPKPHAREDDEVFLLLRISERKYVEVPLEWYGSRRNFDKIVISMDIREAIEESKKRRTE